MRPLITAMFLLGTSLVQLSCSRPETFDTAQIRKSIEEVNAKYSEAIKEGNLAGAVAGYTDDATMISPDGEPIKGKQAIEQYYRTLFQMGMKEVVLTTIEVEGSGGTVYEIGETRVRIQPEGQEAIQDSSKYLVIWKRQADGTWKVHADIWNLSCR